MQIKQSTISWAIIISLAFLFIYLVGGILAPFIFGALVAYFLDPVADKLEERGINRTNSTLIVLGSFCAILVGVIMLFGPLFLDQIGNLITRIPVYVAQLEQQHGDNMKELLHKFVPNIEDQAKDFAFKFSNDLLKISTVLVTGIFSSTAAIFGFLSLVLISPIIAFYLLRDWDVMVKKIDDLLPRNNLSSIRKNFVKIDNIISAYMRGQFTVCLIMATFYSINLTIVGLNYGFAIGFLTGILAFIPYVGMATGCLTALIVGYVQFGTADTFHLTAVAIVFLVGNLIEGNFITPKLVGDSVELHPAWIIFALLAGGTLLGFTGVLIAIPAAAVIGVLTRSSVEVYKHSPLYLGNDYDPSMRISGTFHQEGVVTERLENPIFEGFEEPAVKTPKHPERKIVDTVKVANDPKPKPKKKAKKKEYELKFPKS